MKKNSRVIYLELANEVDTVLCSFCKYARWEGGCSEAYCECEHPIEQVSELELELGDDCWGFRPELAIKDIADIVGMILSERLHKWYWLADGENILVGGVKA